MSNILLIDLSSIAHPIFHMSASEPDPNATSTKTVARVRALASGQPHVAVCCDSGRSFRKDVSADYKAQRPESDATLQHQITLAIETLRGDGFPVWAVKGFEADDLIATAVFQAEMLRSRPGVESPEVQIASADKDLLQLVNGFVSIHSLRDGSKVDEDAVYLKFGVKPNQIRDYLSLVGDASDNIHGCKGVGPKRAVELLTKYQTLEGIFEALTKHGTQFTPALATALREFQPRMAQVRELITLRTDVPIPFDEVFKERIPADTAIFGNEEPENLAEAIAADIEETMQPLPLDIPALTAPVLPPLERPLVDGAAIYQGRIPTPPKQAPERPQAPVGAPIAVTASSSPAQIMRVLEPDVLASAPAEFERQLEPRSMGQAKQLAADLFASRLFSAYGNAPAVLSTILAGRELGLQASASLRGIHVVDGKHMLAADLIRALIIRSGQAKYFRCKARTAEIATFITERKDDNVPIELSYTIEEAQKAGLIKKGSGWEKSPTDMLVARASSKLARLVFPEIVFGLFSPEEID